MTSYPQTDLGNAELFVDYIGRDNWRFDHRRGIWFQWTGHYWEEDRKGEASHAMSLTVRERERRALDCPTDAERTNELNWCLESESASRLGAMLRLAKSQPAIALRGDEWDSDPWLLAVQNGVVDLRTADLLDCSRERLLMLRATARYDPGAQCPRWERFVAEICEGDQMLADYLQRAAGYCLTADTREQVFFNLWGEGSNGKTTFVEVLAHVLGSYSLSLPLVSLTMNRNDAIPNDIAQLPGKRFVTIVESNRRARLNTALIKRLTGGDTMSARFMRREWFQFVPVAKFWLVTNHKPRVDDDSYGYWRRVHLIPLMHVFERNDKDETLREKLITEAPGILTWAVIGCLEWQTKGLGMPPVVSNATKEYQSESDPVGRFVAECCTLGSQYWVKRSELSTAFWNWATDNGDSCQLDQRDLSARLEKLGFTRNRVGHNRDRVWRGIALIPPGEAVAP
jgi:putative DNA primase/helicase